MLALAIALAAIVGVTEPGRGSPPRPVQLAWDSAEASCPPGERFAATTEHYLGRSLAEYPASGEASAHVRPLRGTLALELELRIDGVFERYTLRSADCESLQRQAALLVASAVDPFALGPRAAEPTPAGELPAPPELPRAPPPFSHAASLPPVQRPSRPRPEPSSPPPVPEDVPTQPPLEASPSPARVEPARRPSPRAGPRRLLGSLGAAGVGFVGFFPQPGGGVELEGAVERARFRWQLGTAAWLGGQFRAPDSDRGGDLSAFAARTGPCFVPRVAKLPGVELRLPLCVTAGVGVVRAVAVNTIEGLQRTQAWADVAGDLRLRAELNPRLAVFLGVAAQLNLRRPAWSLSDPPTLYRTPQFTGVARLGVELHFGPERRAGL